jgi:hypothetical protein
MPGRRDDRSPSVAWGSTRCGPVSPSIRGAVSLNHVWWCNHISLIQLFLMMCSPIKETATLLALSNVAPMPTKSWFLCRMFTWGRTLCSKMGEGCFRSIQLIDNFVSAHTPPWGKFDLYSYPNQSPSEGDFKAFGHKEIALHKKFAVAPPTWRTMKNHEEPWRTMKDHEGPWRNTK